MFVSIAKLALQQKVMIIVTQMSEIIIEKSGTRDIDEIFTFIVEAGYELLPFPMRAIIKKEVFVEVVKSNKEKVSEILLGKIDNQKHKQC